MSKRNKGKRSRNKTMYYNLGGTTHSTTFTSNAALNAKARQQSADAYSMLQKATMTLMANGSIGIVITLKNGNAFLDGGISIPTVDGKINNYAAYPVYMSNDKVYDKENGYDGTDCYEYLEILAKKNPKLRIDLTMSMGTPWNEKITNKLNELSVRR